MAACGTTNDRFVLAPLRRSFDRLQDAPVLDLVSTAARPWGKIDLVNSKGRSMASYCHSREHVFEIPDPYYIGPEVSFCIRAKRASLRALFLVWTPQI